MAGMKVVMLNIEEVKKNLYPEEFEAYLKLKKIFAGKKISRKHIVFFYPGSGADVLNPMLYLDALVDWKSAEAIDFIFVDIDGAAPTFICSMLEKLTGRKPKLKFLSDTKARVTFTFDNTRITLTYILADAVENLPKDARVNFDIYFERAFELFRANAGWFIEFVLGHVSKGGLLISDCGFCRQDLLKKYSFVGFGPKELPLELGFYKNLKIYKKK